MTILIKNIQLLDGSAKPAVKADVLVKNEKISAVGNFPRYRADEVIDGMGAYLSPGFIDINAAADRYLTLFSNPHQKDFLLQGVTTIIGGQCGVSLAPLLYGSLNSIRDWADINKINVNWRTVAEFLKAMDKRRLGVNFGTLVGHTTIRQDLAGESARDLSRNELRVFNLILEKSLKGGSFGLSSGLSHQYSRQTSYNEIKALAKTTARFKSLYATELRDEKENLLSSVNEVIKVAKETSARVLINHFCPLTGSIKDYEEALNLIEKHTDKADVYFGIYPSEGSVVLTSDFLPDWIQGDKEEVLKDIQTAGFKEKIIKGLPRLKGEEVIIVNAPGNEYLVGKSLKEFAQNRNLNVSEALLELIKLTNFRAAVFYKNISLKTTIKALIHSRAIISSAGAGFAPFKTNHTATEKEINGKTFIKLLELAGKGEILPLATAIHKITFLPAQRLGLDRRGLVRDGWFADLVLFKDAEIREVIINGKRVVKDGEFQNILAGKVLKHTT
jgi:N-acyl-D-amino-acid deacylase